MNSIVHPVADVFLLGFIAACSLVAGLYFLRFWKATKDPLFLAFLVFFVVQGLANVFVLNLPHPNEGSLLVFVVRLLSVLVVLAAILWKNIAQD